MERFSGSGPYLLTPATEAFLDRSAVSEERILLEGETGSGKTLLSRLIHERSPRRGRPFITVGCGGFASALTEREFFGHVKGAFTGADRSAEGVIESAAGGTLVLNDIDLLPLDHQPKLLDFLDDGGFRRLGRSRKTAVDVRMIATTNQPLGVLVANKLFRSDLFHRIAVLRFRLPALRERREDIPRLLQLLLDGQGGRDSDAGDRNRVSFTPGAVRALQEHAWPGNHREFEGVIARILLAYDGGVVDEEAVREAIGEVSPGQVSEVAEVGLLRPDRPRKVRYRAPADPEEERSRIIEAMRSTKGVRTDAARTLGINRQLLWLRITIHRIREEEWGEPGTMAGVEEPGS